MSGHGFPLAAGIIVLLTAVFCAGCMSTSVVDVGYSGQSIVLDITHAGEPMDAYVQVTVYRLANLTQEQQVILGSPVSLLPGKNSLTIPARLDPGSYKLFVYIFRDGDRKTAVIRDITV